MLVVWFLVIVLVVIVGVFVLVAAGRGESMAEVYDDRPDTVLPEAGELTADKVAELRFSTGFRGYRMDEVDAFMDVVRADLLNRESARDSTRPKHAGPPTDERTSRSDGTSKEPADAPEERPDAEPAVPAETATRGDSDPAAGATSVAEDAAPQEPGGGAAVSRDAT